MTRECILFDENTTCLLASKLYSESFSSCYIWASYLRRFINMVRDDLRRTIEDKSHNTLLNARPTETLLLNEATRLLKKQKVSCLQPDKHNILRMLDDQPLKRERVIGIIEELEMKCLDAGSPVDIYIGLQRIRNIVSPRLVSGMNHDTMAWICELVFIEASMNARSHAGPWFEAYQGSEEYTDSDIVYPFLIEPQISSFTANNDSEGITKSVSFQVTRVQRTIDTQFSILNQEFRIVHEPAKQHVKIYSREMDTDVEFGFLKPAEIFLSVLKSDANTFLKKNPQGGVIVPSRLRGRWSRFLQLLRPHSISIDSRPPRTRAIVTPWGRATYSDNITAFIDPNPITSSLCVVASLDSDKDE